MPVIIVIILIAAGVFVFLIFNKDDQSPEAKPATNSIESSSKNEARLVIGDPGAEATIVEYFDYKCPSCNNFHRTTAQDISRNYVEPGLAKFEIRITPIIGPDSGNAARGAYCANDQHLFGEYHNAVLDFMYDNYYSDQNYSAELQNILTTNKLSEIAIPLGIDPAPFEACVDSDKYNPNLDSNLLAAADDGIRGTPGFAVGEQSFVVGQPYSVFQTLIDIELQ